MLKNILEMLQLAEDYQDNEIISIAKGRYQYTNNIIELFKKAMKWQ